MRKLIALIGLQAYALALAFVQLHNGVRTDEAKYLLDIPYPHPPLARWLLGFIDGWAWQEHIARIMFAMLLVHAVWLVWDMGRALKPGGRMALAVLWLGSVAFVTQAGTVMMAPLTAFETLLFLWMLTVPKHRVPGVPVIAFLWLMTLFTALQGALLAPLVIAVLRLKGVDGKTVVWTVLIPLVLVAFYALGNPLLLASLTIQVGKDAGHTFVDRAQGLAWILVLAGSGIGSIAGVIGLALKRHWLILASFVLFAGYVFLGRYEYYAILFLPFFITGAKHLFRRVPLVAVPTGLLIVACTGLLLVFRVPLFTQRSPARYVLRQLPETALVVLKGSFGHEWQYEASPNQSLRLYSADAARHADVIVCFDDCGELEDRWAEQDGGLANTWWRMARGQE